MQNNPEILKSIGALEEAVKNLAQVAIRMDDKALDERHAIYDKVDQLRQEILVLSTRFDGINSKMDVVFPIAKSVEEDMQRSQGARRLGKFIWGIIISLVTIGIAAMGQIFGYLHHP